MRPPSSRSLTRTNRAADVREFANRTPPSHRVRFRCNVVGNRRKQEAGRLSLTADRWLLRGGTTALPRNDDARFAPGYAHPVREDDPYHTVRTIGRVCQMLLELRDEYERRPRPALL